MRAIVFERYGPPENLSLREVEKPRAGRNEVLVKVRAAAVSPLDWHGLRGTPLLARLLVGGLLKPGHQVLGSDVAGTVESIGADVTRLAVGDEVFGMSLKHGAFAEYIVLPEAGVIARKPSDLDFDEAAAVPSAAAMALMGLRDQAKIGAGEKVLINGASGGIGTFAVQIAKASGAEVTGVCSARNLDLVRSLGADRVIDYTQTDFTREHVRYDVLFDVVARRTFAECRRVLGRQGRFVTTAISVGLAVQSAWIALSSTKRMKPMLQPPKRKDLAVLRDMIESGAVRPVIDRRFQLAEVPEAIAYVEKGHACGKVVIEIDP
jgi:NADPH:quinone reductase-like Zn-dependent oxidoreductase